MMNTFFLFCKNEKKKKKNQTVWTFFKKYQHFVYLKKKTHTKK